MENNIDFNGLKRILDSVALGVFTVDQEWIISFFNKEAERITGFSAGQALGKRCWEIFNSDRCDKRCYLRRAMDSGKNVVKVRVEIINRNKRRIPLEITAAVLHDEQGRILGGVESMLDLTARQALEKTIRQSYKYSDIVGRDPTMQRLFKTLDVVAPSDATMLLRGETGTGKDLLARVIHNNSPRKTKPYVKVNCAAIPANLLESELFGYRKGAFTDAQQDKPGLFRQAQGGTVFLDEVADIPRELQAKLFQVLDEQVYHPLGATQAERVDVRLVAATNRDLGTMVESGEFRSDLYYRLRVVELTLPPLRERLCDIPLLIEHFTAEIAACQGKQVLGLEPRALQRLLDYKYPGNVRELRHMIEHGVVLATSDQIMVEDLPQYLVAEPLSSPEPLPLKEPDLRAREAEILRQALEEHGHRMAETAQALGIDRSTLWRRRKKYGI